MTSEKEKKVGKYLYFSELRIKNLISYMKASESYKLAEINSLFDSKSEEVSSHYILGVLIQNNILKIGGKDIIELSRDESNFREVLLKSKVKKVLEVLEKFSISSASIKSEEVSYDPLKFNPYEFMRLIIEKSDIEILEVLKKKKLI